MALEKIKKYLFQVRLICLILVLQDIVVEFELSFFVGENLFLRFGVNGNLECNIKSKKMHTIKPRMSRFSNRQPMFLIDFRLLWLLQERRPFSNFSRFLHRLRSPNRWERGMHLNAPRVRNSFHLLKAMHGLSRINDNPRIKWRNSMRYKSLRDHALVTKQGVNSTCSSNKFSTAWNASIAFLCAVTCCARCWYSS